MTNEDAIANARAAVQALLPLTEAAAWAMARYGTPWTDLTAAQLDALEELDRLDYLMAGISRGCCWGACALLDGTPAWDTSWRA